MDRRRRIFWAKLLVAGGAIPLALWAYEYGPDPGYSGVPTERGGATCASGGQCHLGPANSPSNKGSVVVNFPNGAIYTAGVKQHLSVTISDPAATQRGWGFQLTARQTDSTVMAGTFASTDNRTLLLCSQESKLDFVLDQINFNAGGSQVCPTADNVQFIEHSQQGWQATLGPGSATYEFDWTPPPANVGNIIMYVAGNAGLGAPASANGSHIYATTYTLKPVAAGPAPTIAAGGVVSASAFGQFTSIGPGSWIEVYGTNLDPGAPPAGIQWSGGDFTNGVGPTSLDGITVSIGGQLAYLSFVSPGQINAQVPSNIGTGTENVVVTNGGGSSAAYAITVNATQPGLWAPGFLNIGGKQYVGAFHTDGSYVLPVGAIAGITSRPATVGETILMYGIGFGNVTPSFTAGQTVTQLNKLTQPLAMTFGSTPAAAPFPYAGLLPPFVGLYQFNVVVPNAGSNGALPLSFSLNGTSGSQTLFTAVK